MNLDSTPLAHYPKFKSNDIDEVQDFISRNISPFKVNTMSRRKKLTVQYNGLSIHNMMFLCSSFSEDVLIKPEAKNYFITQTTLTGNTEVSLRKDSAKAAKGSTIVTSASESYEMRLLKGCRRLTVLFDRSALEHQLSLLVNQEINKPLIFNLEMGDANGCRSTWLNSLLYLCEQFSLSNRTTGNEPYLWHANNMLMSLLLEIQPHNYSHLLSRDEKANSPKFVRRAIAYIEEHVRQPISLTELASFAGTSTRTLQRGFLKYTGKNPCEYIRLVKVHAVYEALKAACPGSQVSDILYDYGISSFGHFTRAYKGVYGCTPSETLNK